MRKHFKLILALLLPALFCTFLSDAEAYSYRSCFGKKRRWQNAPVSLNLLPASFPSGGMWEGAFTRAVRRWNDVKGSWVSFSLSHQSNNSYSHNDGINQIYWSNLNDPDFLAYTFLREKCSWSGSWSYKIREADIGFNTIFSWATEEYPLFGDYTFEPVAKHELGHALGLNHENRRLATMNQSYPFGGGLGHHERWRVHADDIQGARVLYPQTETHRDLTTSKFKRVSNRTVSIEGPCSSASSYCQAPAGSTVTVDFTFENLGNRQETFNIGFYLSKDRHITTSDIHLGSNYGAWGDPGFSGTFTRAVTLPAMLPTGAYYLGYIVDVNRIVPQEEELVTYNLPTGSVQYFPTNFYRNNFMALPLPITVLDDPNLPNQYHITSEVTWADIQASAFGWIPSDLYLLSGSVAGSSPLPVAGCGPSVDIVNPTVRHLTSSAWSQTTLIPPVSYNPVSGFNYNSNTGSFSFYFYPYPNPPHYVQVLARTPNGCFVKSPRRNYRFANEP